MFFPLAELDFLTLYPLKLQTSSSLDRRRRRAGGAELKDEDGLENEESAAGNPAGGTPTPSSGVGVSTRRTTYVVVRKIQSV